MEKFCLAQTLPHVKSNQTKALIIIKKLNTHLRDARDKARDYTFTLA